LEDFVNVGRKPEETCSLTKNGTGCFGSHATDGHHRHFISHGKSKSVFQLLFYMETGELGYVLTPGVKRPEREADHSLPSSAEVKNLWKSYASIPSICLHGVVLN
jgi:hypothetical protein